MSHDYDLEPMIQNFKVRLSCFRGFTAGKPFYPCLIFAARQEPTQLYPSTCLNGSLNVSPTNIRLE